MNPLLIIIIIIIFVFLTNNNKKPSGNRSSKPTKSITVSFGNETPRPYSSVLNQIEMDVHYIANYTRGYGKINVVVNVQKINNTYCAVTGNFLADCSFNGVTCGTGYTFNGNDLISFQTNLATGFSSLDAVKREILLQFNWDDLPVYNAEFTILDYGEFAYRPYISYSFTIKKD